MGPGDRTASSARARVLLRNAAPVVIERSLIDSFLGVIPHIDARD